MRAAYEQLVADGGGLRRVEAVMAAAGRTLAEVAEGHGRAEVRTVLLDGEVVDGGLPAALAGAEAFLPAVVRLTHVRALLDRTWLDKGTPVEPWLECVVVSGARAAARISPRDAKTGREVAGRRHGILLGLAVDGRRARVTSWRPTWTWDEALDALGAPVRG